MRARAAAFANRTEFGVGAGEHDRSLIGEFDLPFADLIAKYTESAASTQPAFSNFLELLHTVGDVAFGVLVGEVQQMNGACGMGNVDGNITDLAKAVGAFVNSEELRNGCGGGCALFSGGDVGR